MQRAKSEYAIQTVTNALRVLEAFETDEQLGVTELARRLHLHKNNVFRLLATLEEKRLGRAGRHRALSTRRGVRAARPRLRARARSLTRHGRPALDALCRETGETAHLAVLRDFEVVHLDGEQALGQLVRALAPRRSAAAALHRARQGAARLRRAEHARALRPRDRREARQARARTERRRSSDRDKLIEHLRRVATQGFALDVEECERGVSCAAAPVFDATGRARRRRSRSRVRRRASTPTRSRVASCRRSLRAGATLSRAARRARARRRARACDRDELLLASPKHRVCSEK